MLTRKDQKIQNRCKAVMDVLQNSWFTRCWIIQEYTLGGRNVAGREDIVVCYGTLCVPSFVIILAHIDLSQFALHYEYSLIRSKVAQNSLGTIRRKFKLRQRPVAFSKPEYLLTCVLLFMESAVTDKRDKIYSLLSLIDEQYRGSEPDHHGWPSLVIDYEAKVEDVWSSFVKEVIQSTKRLEILGFCDGTRAKHCERTWTLNCCPKNGEENFSQCVLASDIRHSDPVLPLNSQLQFNVAGDTKADFQFAEDLSTLSVSGFVWAEIERPYNIKFSGPQQLKSTLLSMIQWGETSSSSSSNDRWEERLLTCLIVAPKGPASKGLDFPAVAYQLLDDFKEWLTMDIDDKWETEQRKDGTLTTWPSVENSPTRFSATLAQSYGGGIIAMTKDGYIGRAISPLVEAGDLICILLGCAMPMVLHPVEGHFEVRGEVYVPGIMHGEAMTTLHAGERKIQTFELH